MTKNISLTYTFNDKEKYLITELFMNKEAKEIYKIITERDIIKFGLRLVRKYFDIKDPLYIKDMKKIKDIEKWL